jgi:hypothetical protein
MWEPRRLTTLWGSTAFHRGSFTFFLTETLENKGLRTCTSAWRKATKQLEGMTDVLSCLGSPMTEMLSAILHLQLAGLPFTAREMPSSLWRALYLLTRILVLYSVDIMKTSFHMRLRYGAWAQGTFHHKALTGFEPRPSSVRSLTCVGSLLQHWSTWRNDALCSLRLNLPYWRRRLYLPQKRR